MTLPKINFQNFNGAWSQLGLDIDGDPEKDSFGSTISLSKDGSTIAVGAPHNDNKATNSGLVRVYKFHVNNWVQLGSDLEGNNEYDLFGNSVSLSFDGTLLAVGSVLNDSNGEDSGLVKIYKNKNGIWSQIGNEINGQYENDRFGGSVSINSDGSEVAIGSPHFDPYEPQGPGYVKVYKLFESNP